MIKRQTETSSEGGTGRTQRNEEDDSSKTLLKKEKGERVQSFIKKAWQRRKGRGGGKGNAKHERKGTRKIGGKG